ncbi:MAG: cytochrome c oxidase subunit II [Sphingobacteriaceae bacterium]
MGFKKLFQYKLLFVLLIALFFITQNVSAQDSPAMGKAEVDEAARSAMWLSVAYYTFLFLLVCVVIGVIGKIFRIYDLTMEIQGKKKGINWNSVNAVICAIFLVLGLYGTYWTYDVLGSMILPAASSVHGIKIDEMFYITLILTTIVLVITQTLLFGFSYLYRGSENRKAYFYPHNNTIEKIWTIVPAVALTILVLMGFFTWRSITNNMDVAGQPAALNVDITGRQFAWEVRYPGLDNKLGVKNYKLVTASNILGVDFKDRSSYDDLHADEIVIPVNKAVRLNIIAQDVIHSVYMPHFRVQMNAVPGLPTHFMFTPTITTAEMREKLDKPKFDYLLLCNKICGSGHYNMQRVVRVVTEEEYKTWLTEQKPYLNDQLRKELKLANISPKHTVVEDKIALNN